MRRARPRAVRASYTLLPRRTPCQKGILHLTGLYATTSVAGRLPIAAPALAQATIGRTRWARLAGTTPLPAPQISLQLGHISSSAGCSSTQHRRRTSGRYAFRKLHVRSCRATASSGGAPVGAGPHAGVGWPAASPGTTSATPCRGPALVDRRVCVLPPEFPSRDTGEAGRALCCETAGRGRGGCRLSGYAR